MAQINLQQGVIVSATIELNEVELRALDALVGYGIEPFLKVFYEKLGSSYMRPYEAGLRSVFDVINDTVHRAVQQVEHARRLMQKQEEAYVLLQKQREVQSLEKKMGVGEDAGLLEVFMLANKVKSKVETKIYTSAIPPDRGDFQA